MGIVNWALKGVKTERKKKDKPMDSDIQMPQPFVPPVAVDVAPIPEALDKKCEPVAPAPRETPLLFDISTPAPQQYDYNQTVGGGQPNFNSTFNGTAIGNRHILRITPRTDQEISAIVEHLKTNEAVIVNFEGIPVCDIQRRLDFLAGVARGIGGDIKALDTVKYIITPNGIAVR